MILKINQKIQQILNFRYIMLLLIISIFVASVFFEIFISNYQYFYYGSKHEQIKNIEYQDMEQYEDELVLSGENPVIRLNNINRYVGHLNFQIDSYGKSIFAEVFVDGVKLKDDSIQQINNKAISIDEYAGCIEIRLIKPVSDENKTNFNYVNSETDIAKIKVGDFFNDVSFEFNIFRFLLTVYFGGLVVLLLHLWKKRGLVKLERVFLLISLSFGLICVFFVPAIQTYDEAEHFVKAYNISYGNIIMNEGELLNYPVGFDSFYNKKTNLGTPDYESYSEYQTEISRQLKLNYGNTELKYYPSTAITYTFIPYIASGFGILLGRILTGSFIISFYLGRMFNLLLYIGFAYFAIKNVPVGKRLLFVCALIPVVVFQAASYSVDGMLNGVSFFLFSLIIKTVVSDEKIGKKMILGIIGCLVLIISSKATYFPLVLLVLLLKNKNFKTKKQALVIKAGIIIGSVVLFGVVFMYGKLFGLIQWPVPGVNATEQVLMILKNPLRYGLIIYRTIRLGYLELLNNLTVILASVGQIGDGWQFAILFVVLFIALVDNKPSDFTLQKKENMLVLGVVLSVIVISMSALYITFTPLGSGIILGFQGRYLVPVIFPMVFILKNKFFYQRLGEGKFNLGVIFFCGFVLFIAAKFIFSQYYI